MVKEDCGGAEIKKLKTGETMDFGNDCKAACSDALKRCAMSIGFFADVYAPDLYRTAQRMRDQLKVDCSDSWC